MRYGATAGLPLLMLWQAWRSLRHREGIANGRVNLVAALLVLQWCAVLIGWGMLPFALWHWGCKSVGQERHPHASACARR